MKKINKQQYHLEFIQFLNENGYQYISGEYTTKQASMYKTICPNGHYRETSVATYYDYGCSECYFQKCSENRRLDINIVKDILSKDGYTLIGEYINKDKPMETLCPNNHLYKVTLGNYKRGRRCQKCKEEKIYTLSEAKLEFEKYRLIPLFDHVNDKKEKLPFLCPEHEEQGKQFVSLSGLRRKDYRCKFCNGGTMRTGINHHNWKGGVSSISEYLRHSLYHSWILPSLKNNNFKCKITEINSPNLIVHHINKNFSEIVQETFEELNIEIKQRINDYDTQELTIIKNKCLEVHLKYGLGIPLLKDIHRLFHHLYGVYNNNINQFEEFQVRWNNNEFETLFDENYNLLINFK